MISTSCLLNHIIFKHSNLCVNPEENNEFPQSSIYIIKKPALYTVCSLVYCTIMQQLLYRRPSTKARLMQQERSAQWSFIVLLSSVMLPGGVSGGLASGGTCQAVRVWTRAGQTWASWGSELMTHGVDPREGRGQLVSEDMSHTLKFIHT